MMHSTLSLSICKMGFRQLTHVILETAESNVMCSEAFNVRKKDGENNRELVIT